MGRPGGGPGGNLIGAGNMIGGGIGCAACGCVVGTGSVPGGTSGSVCAVGFEWFSSLLSFSIFFCTVSISFMNSSTFWPDRATIFCCRDVGLTVFDSEGDSSCAVDISSSASSVSSAVSVEKSSTSPSLFTSGGGPGGHPGGSFIGCP